MTKIHPKNIRLSYLLLYVTSLCDIGKVDSHREGDCYQAGLAGERARR